MARYWEDYDIGEKYQSPGQTITDGMATIYNGLLGYSDPWLIDEEEAKKSVFGTRVAAGSLTLAFADTHTLPSDVETQIALVGLEGRFKSGARIGDTVRAESEIIEKRPTKDPGRGLIIVKTIVRNQLGTEIVEAKIVNMVKRKTQ